MKTNKNKGSGYYTFMFFPEGKGHPFTLRIHRYTINLTIMSLILIFIGLFVLLFKTGEAALKLQLVHDLKLENRRLREHSRDLEISSRKIASIDSLTVYLHRLASVTDIGDAVAAKPAEAAPGKPAAAARPGAPVVDMGQPGIQPEVHTEAARPEEERIAEERRSTPPGGGYIQSIPNIMPADGWLTKQFSGNPADAHKGIDIAAAEGTPIRVTAKGVVENVHNDRFFGLMVEIRHDNGYLTRYCHCSQILVSVGERVNRGQTIALVGNTGRSTAPHLHYEVMKSGKYVDPMNFIGAHK
ncbi:MAG: M23 family metallopeptidase [Chitinispirillia bacterium]|nr:M23 family metallopeptidase [Chitinispirillia bacterium]MCL2241885.1 M23 family metallopeptidase [Chitinispirillia bacterium]